MHKALVLFGQLRDLQTLLHYATWSMRNFPRFKALVSLLESKWLAHKKKSTWKIDTLAIAISLCTALRCFITSPFSLLRDINSPARALCPQTRKYTFILSECRPNMPQSKRRVWYMTSIPLHDSGQSRPLRRCLHKQSMEWYKDLDGLRSRKGLKSDRLDEVSRRHGDTATAWISKGGISHEIVFFSYFL